MPRRWFRMRRLWIAAVALAVTSCGDSPSEPPSIVECGGVETAVLSLEPLQGTTVRGDALSCIALRGGGASYIIAPQLVGGSLSYGSYGYRLGDPDVSVSASLSPNLRRESARARAESLLAADPQRRLDAWLRDAESRMAIDRRAVAGARRDGSVTMAGVPLDVGSVREFNVLSSLTVPVAFARAGARLRFAGERILIYVDTVAATAFADEQIARLGALLDGPLAETVHAAFGSESDIDANGRVIVLFTPVVNALIPAPACGSGYVRGFFYAHDLESVEPTSNRGEIFYGFVPDPQGRWSCPLASDLVFENLPPTFVHEFQHMISYGERVVSRGGPVEEPWLNEGLSHLAEEFGSLHYEAKYPAPTGRTNPGQLFPDSAGPFITPNLRSAHWYLFLSDQYSALTCVPGTFCSLTERSAAWLFLRWLGDQKGASVYRDLLRTTLTGTANVEAAAGESLAELFGDFTIALWADTIPGVPRYAVSSRHRFHSRNFRTLYEALYDLYGPIGGIARPFPIEPLPLASDGPVSGTMRPGTFVMYRLDTPGGVSVARIRFSGSGGALFPLDDGAQLSVFRMPP